MIVDARKNEISRGKRCSIEARAANPVFKWYFVVGNFIRLTIEETYAPDPIRVSHAVVRFRRAQAVNVDSR